VNSWSIAESSFSTSAARGVEPRERVERLAQHLDRDLRRVPHRREALRVVPPCSWIALAMRAIFSASSPMRSRSVTILLIPMIRRRSLAAGLALDDDVVAGAVDRDFVAVHAAARSRSPA
jgi:hypothetical protein